MQERLRNVFGRDFAAGRLPLIYSFSLKPRAFAREAIISSVSNPDLMRSALTALARMPSAP